MRLSRRFGPILVALSSVVLAACVHSRSASPESALLARVVDVPETNAKRYERAVEMFKRDGCVHPRLRSLPVGRSAEPNLECTLPGETDAVILIGAHFDKLGKHQGIVDNWSGTCLLPALYRVLASSPRRHTFRFVAFADEELGLRGSRDYVRGLDAAQRKSIRAMVNLDTFGWGSPKAVLNRTDPQLASHLETVLKQLDRSNPNLKVDGYLEDSEPFRKAGIPTVVFTGLDAHRVPDLHTEADRLANFDRESFLDAYRLLAHYVVSLDEFLAESKRP